ncbi:MAG: Xaa-Pro peptidase family protein [Armatimonadota bacterium]|nr:Xaa-Pro peptidase family protein [Armatimonadota bacterium]MDR7448955.1 Xaa-Pro peptidase family protein [Armatimonadota bacterium]MDR7460373.1 Xaa-Pro peptidase family protein [Armatimonadota bacterium]MDR7480541.1 Xaa-Pro peptidase family protein [Armatimonadota bacterium]MDR7489164.1 Xaa-Pro peptidase family protein [Armatimonadota bacterium]
MAVTLPPITRTPVFPREEFEARLARVRAALNERGDDALLAFAPETLFYLTGYQTFAGRTYAALLVPPRGAPVLVLRFLESFLAALYSEVAEVVTYDDHEDPLEVTAAAVRARGFGRARVAFEEGAPGLSAAVRRRLGGLLDGVTASDGTAIVERLRRVKSPREVEHMRRAARMTEAGMRAGLEACRPGATENDVAAAAMAALARAGSEYFPCDPIITSGYRAGIPHTSFERRRLEPGDTVLLEMTGVYGRYVAPLMRAAVLGEPSPAVRRMADLCLEGLERAIQAVRPGATAGEVDDACRRVMEEAGVYQQFRKRTGYSVGFAFPPNWNEGHLISLRRDDPTVLEPGMVFHMPPALRDYGVSCVGFSETVVVTAQGCEVLTHFPRELALR